MSTPTLRKVSGRSGLTHPITPIYREVAAPQPRSVGEGRDESVYSDPPELSSSANLSQGHSTDLKRTFPSIYRSMDLMKSHCRNRDTAAFRTTALVFLTTFRTVIAETNKLPGLQPTDNDLQVCRASTTSTGKLFESHIENLEDLARIDSQAVTSALRVAQIALSTLEHLHQFTVLTSRNKKALPSIPDQEDETSVYHDAVSVIQNPVSVTVAPPSIIASTSLGSNSSVTKVNSIATSSTVATQEKVSVAFASLDLAESTDSNNVNNLPGKGGLAHRLKQKVSHYPKVPSIFSQKNKSTATLADPRTTPALPSYMNDDEDYIEDDFVITRHSTIYFPNDPRLDYSRLPQAQPQWMSSSLHFDNEGNLKSGTLAGLIGVLSSSGGISNAHLLDLVTKNFHQFSSHSQFFAQLVARYDERPPHASQPSQVRRWEREFRAVRVRVVKILLYWLKESWMPETEASILPEVRDFVEHRARDVISDNLLNLLRDQITINERDASVGNRSWKNDEPPLSPTKSKFCDLGVQLLAYDTPRLRLACARQLTAKVSAMYLDINPSGLATYWALDIRDKELLNTKQSLTEAERKALNIRNFEEAFMMWIALTIMRPHDRQQRIDLISFWLNVSLECLEMRNFSTACCIYTGVAHPSVGRMKDTILRVPRDVKARFHKLERFFSGHGNYKQARTVMDGPHSTALPMVPLSAPLKHDVGVSAAISKYVEHENVTMINLQHYEAMTRVIKSLKNIVPYGIEKDVIFQEWLDDQLVRFLNYSKIRELYDTLYDLGKSREPEVADPTLPVPKPNDPWTWVFEKKDWIGPLDPAALAASASINLNMEQQSKAGSLFHSLRSRATRDKK